VGSRNPQKANQHTFGHSDFIRGPLRLYKLRFHAPRQPVAALECSATGRQGARVPSAPHHPVRGQGLHNREGSPHGHPKHNCGTAQPEGGMHPTVPTTATLGRGVGIRREATGIRGQRRRQLDGEGPRCASGATIIVMAAAWACYLQVGCSPGPAHVGCGVPRGVTGTASCAGGTQTGLGGIKQGRLSALWHEATGSPRRASSFNCGLAVTARATRRQCAALGTRPCWQWGLHRGVTGSWRVYARGCQW
jgi:hypothetical protein